jgi:hypothetical protein
MPALFVSKNGFQLCTVGSDDVWMFSASVWGELWGPEVSMLDVSGGGKRRPNGTGDFLIWEMPHELTRGDRIALRFEEGAVSNPKGKLFDPSAESVERPKVDMSFAPTADEIAKLASRPPLNTGLKWSVSINHAPAISAAPDAERQHIALHVLWNEERPHRMRVSLSKSSLREIFDRTTGEKLFLEYVPLGSSVEISVGL